MKFGLYVHPSTDLVVRCVDGHFDLIQGTPEHSNSWDYWIKSPGYPCNQAAIRTKLASAGSLLTWGRSIAEVMYGIPDNVELYAYGDFGIQTAEADYIANNS